MPGLIAEKLGMTRIFTDDGSVIPITLLHCPPVTVTQVKTVAKNGHQAVVLGFSPLKKPRKTRKFRCLREFRVENAENYKVGDTVTLESLKEVKQLTLTAFSKGKGFAGFIKRHHFSSGPGSHGSHHKREPGAVGARSKPGRIIKGKRMAGHMGFEKITHKHVPIIEIDIEKNILAVKGPVPGPKGTLVTIKY